MMRNEKMNPKELKFPQGAGHEKCREVFAAQAGKARVYKDNGFTVIFSRIFVPATFYFPRQSPTKYHRR